MGSPVEMSQVNTEELSPELDAVLSVDTTKGNRIMKQTSKQHLRFALEMLVFTIFPIMETAKTPIVLGQIYVLFFLCVEVIGWMYVKSLRENAQNAKNGFKKGVDRNDFRLDTFFLWAKALVVRRVALVEPRLLAAFVQPVASGARSASLQPDGQSEQGDRPDDQDPHTILLLFLYYIQKKPAVTDFFESDCLFVVAFGMLDQAKRLRAFHHDKWNER